MRKGGHWTRAIDDMKDYQWNVRFEQVPTKDAAALFLFDQVKLGRSDRFSSVHVDTVDVSMFRLSLKCASQVYFVWVELTNNVQLVCLGYVYFCVALSID